MLTKTNKGPKTKALQQKKTALGDDDKRKNESTCKPQ